MIPGASPTCSIFFFFLEHIDSLATLQDCIFNSVLPDYLLEELFENVHLSIIFCLSVHVKITFIKLKVVQLYLILM